HVLFSYPASTSLISSHYALLSIVFFFFNAPATTEIYTLSLHDALPICDMERDSDRCRRSRQARAVRIRIHGVASSLDHVRRRERSEEHTSELQSLTNLVCRLLLEKKKKHINKRHDTRDTYLSDILQNTN